MGRLSLALLGAPEVCHGGEPVVFATRKALALLVYLAVEARPQRRDRLAALFWPDSGRGAGRATLRSALGRARDALGGAADHLVVDRDAVSFEVRAAHELDVRRLEDAQRLVRAPSGSGEARRATVDELARAAGLCRGPFLEGLSLPDAPDFDDWVDLQRQVRQRHAEAVLDRLSELQAAEGALADAAETLTRWLALSPLEERAHQRLIEVHLAAGDRAAALGAYRSCRTRLRDELGVEPAPAIQALFERVRASPSGRASARPDGAPVPALLHGPLVGRTDEFAKLVELYHTARAGRAQAVVLCGEAGIGKTRLAAELLAWAAAQGADVVQGRAFETGGRMPYQPLVQALRPRLEQENAPEDLLGDVWLAELGRLLPELRERYPDLPTPAGDEAAARARLFEAVARLGRQLAARAPLALFVDDLQWADAASLDVLRYAARRWAESGTPVFLLLGVRAEALAESRALEEWLAGLGRDVPTTRLELGPLTAEDTLALLRGLRVEDPTATARPGAGAPAGPERFAHWLFAETGGQPLFVTETLKALLERAVLVRRPRADGAWAIDVAAHPQESGAAPGFIAPGVRDTIRARLARLTPAAGALLAAAAVLGQGFTFEQLARVAGLEEDAALPALDEALRGHLLREANSHNGGQPAGAYLFTHDRIRDVAYAEAGGARRRVFHRRALEALGAATAAVLAHHALAAGLEESALRFSTAAGDDAARLLAPRDAAGHYGNAVELATRLERSDLLAELHARRGRAFVAAVLWAEARRELEAALERLAADEDPRRAEVLADLSEACWWLTDVAATRRYASEAVALAARLGRADLETRAAAFLAGAPGSDGDVAAVVEHTDRAIGRARELGVAPHAQVWMQRSLALYWLGRGAEAGAASREAIGQARAANDVANLLSGLAHLGLALAGSGRYAEADGAFAEARRLGREHGVATLTARAIAMSAGFRLDLFDYAVNETLAHEAREAALSAGFLPPAVSAGIDLLLNFARRGEVGRADELVDGIAEHVERAAGFHGWLWRLRLAAARAEMALVRGDHEGAVRWADEAIQQSHARRRTKYEALGLVTRAQALAGLGRAGEALPGLRCACELARGLDDPALILRAASALLAIGGNEEVVAAEGRAAVERIAAALPHDAVRSPFMAAEPVRALTQLA